MKNRIERLTYILSQLSKGNTLSTSFLSEELDVTLKIIRTDFNEYILPLFDDYTIFYSHPSKSYVADTNFLVKTPFSAEELAIIAILKSKSKDKYSDITINKYIQRYKIST